MATATQLLSEPSSREAASRAEGMAEMPAADAEPVMDGSATFAPPASPSQQRPGDRAVGVLWSFGKCLGALLPVYLAGYYGFSITLVLFGVVIFMGWKHSRLDKTMRLKSAMYLLENERAFTTESAFRAKRDLPPWVSTHDLQLVSFDATVGGSCAVTSCFTPADLRACLAAGTASCGGSGIISIFLIFFPIRGYSAWPGSAPFLDIPNIQCRE